MENDLEILIKEGIKIKEKIDESIKNNNEGSYPKDVFQWNEECINKLRKRSFGDTMLYQFTKSDYILSGLKDHNGVMIPVFGTHLFINKEPADISSILEKKIDFLILVMENENDKSSGISNIKYTLDEKTCSGSLLIDGYEPINFEGKTALVLNYFHQLSLHEKGTYKNFKDFNAYQKLIRQSDDMSSKIFAQTIREINKSVTKRIPIISQIIQQKDKTSKATEANLYILKLKTN